MSHITVTQERHTTTRPARRRPRRRTTHLALRGGRWVWRRRLPAQLLRHFGDDDSSCDFRDIQIALGTGDRGMAVVRAALLDAGFEQWAAVQMGADVAKEQVTLGAALAAFRSRAITWSEVDRAARPAGVKGVDVPVTEWSLPQDLGRDLCAFAEQPDAIGQHLPLDLLARLTEALAPAASTAGKPYGVVAGELAAAMAEDGTRPVRTSLLGERARRAAVAEGRARFIERAMLANDTDIAEEHLARFEVEEGLSFEPNARRVMLRYALRMLAEVAREDARRDRGKYPVPEVDPLMVMSIQSCPSGGGPGGARPECHVHAGGADDGRWSGDERAVGASRTKRDGDADQLHGSLGDRDRPH
ncbi:DUF6538 domain-containing protein [Roseomonas chloroacetimidivorans]|uniref:DUF6538 domain-containing protein n=1 Tax=Roseomonas chloroacetimidivorans TaxID=1766656 RepID=UPI003C75DD3F